MIFIKNNKDLELMRESGKIVGEVLNKVRDEIKEGITTKYLDKFSERLILKHRGIPAFKGYRGFPYTVCASVNDEVVHGFPNDRILKNGDIVTIDVGVLKNNYYGDAAVTYPVGKISKKSKKLLTITKECLSISIEHFQNPCQVGTIANIIQQHSEMNGFNVVKEFGGHGIGKILHEEPFIPNYGSIGIGSNLITGTCVAIEPILTYGSGKIYIKEDGWTVKTVDKSVAAHFEHTVFLTENGPEILTIND